MTTSRVRAVKLRLRIPADDAERAGELRSLAESRLIRGVVEALDARVRARLGPDAIVRVARLPVRWKLGEAELADPAVHVRLGEELADGLLDAAGASSAAVIAPRPRPGASIAVFTGEAHMIAVALADHADGRAAAFHHPAPSIDAAWELAMRGGPALLGAVIDQLVALGAVRTGSPVAAIPADAAATIPVTVLARWPARIRGWVVSAAARAATSAGEPPVEPVLPAAREPITDPAPHVAAEPGPRVDPGRDDATGIAVPALDRIPTAVGGAVFLVGRVLELELAEHLWCAGLIEGPWIADAIALFVPEELRADPLFAAIGGDGDRAPAADWAAAEVIERTRDSLGRWLARRGDARTAEQLEVELARLAADLGGAGVSGVVAAAVAVAVAARLEVGWDAAPARALALRAGAFTVDDDELRVELPLATVDVDVRRAGLDADPGWVPWLRRTLRVAYLPGDGDVI